MRKARHRHVPVLRHLFLFCGGALMLYPLVFMLLASFFSKQEYATTVLSLFPWPQHPTLDNFAIILKSKDISIALANSVGRTVYMVAFTSLTTFFGGYTFGRLRFKGRDTLFFILLATEMLPRTVLLIPNYIQFARWPLAGGNNIFYGGQGILDSYWVYLVFGPAMNIMGTFVVRQYIQNLPMAYDESARLDGAGTLQVMFRILLPMCGPIMAYIAITTAITTWNDWQTPFFFTNSPKYSVLPSTITRLSYISSGGLDLPNYPLIMAISLMLTLPVLLFYFWLQKHIVEGLASYGIKE